MIYVALNGEDWFSGPWVIVLGEDIVDVVLYCETAGAFGVIPIKIDA